MTRELLGTVIDANGVACSVYLDEAETVVVMEWVSDSDASAIKFVCTPTSASEIARMLMGQRPRGLQVM